MTMTDEWDGGSGFAPIALELERQFGCKTAFGLAGGCVNMNLTLETGHVICITDAFSPLTPIPQRHYTNGFGFQVWCNEDDLGWGREPLIVWWAAPCTVQQLPDLVEMTLRKLVERS